MVDPAPAPNATASSNSLFWMIGLTAEEVASQDQRYFQKATTTNVEVSPVERDFLAFRMRDVINTNWPIKYFSGVENVVDEEELRLWFRHSYDPHRYLWPGEPSGTHQMTYDMLWEAMKDDLNRVHDFADRLFYQVPGGVAIYMTIDQSDIGSSPQQEIEMYGEVTDFRPKQTPSTEGAPAPITPIGPGV